jgi:hypothetical protein
MKKIVATETTDLGDRQIQFTISNEEQDRDEDIMIAAGCDFSNYAKNPQFLGFHNYWDFPLGRPVKWWIDRLERKVNAVVYFPTIEELTGGLPQNASEKVKLVDTTYYFYKNKLLNAVSIGFDPIESKPNPESKHGWGSVISKWELLEFSACPIPANQDALATACKSYDPSGRLQKIFEEGRTMRTKGAIPFKHFPLADEDTAWDAGEVFKASDDDDLAIICAWKADKKPEDLTKADFKLPHHQGKEDGYKTVWKGVAAAMTVLRGGRGGVDIPEEDLDAVEAHLAKHYKEFGKEVPEKSWKPDEKSGARLSADSLAALGDIEKCHRAIKSKMAKLSSLHEDMKGHLDELEEAHATMKAAIRKLRDGPGDADGAPPKKPESQDDQAEGGDQSVLDITDAD